MPTSNPTKQCSTCRDVLPLGKFAKDPSRKIGVRSQCAICVSKGNRRSYRKHREKHRAYARGRYATRRDYKLRWSYGISQDIFNELLDAQGGRCAICLTTEPKGKHGQFMVDHDHKTGRVRGLLCHRCNLILGQMGDDLNNVLKFSEYLQGSVPTQTAIAVKTTLPGSDLIKDQVSTVPVKLFRYPTFIVFE